VSRLIIAKRRLNKVEEEKKKNGTKILEVMQKLNTTEDDNELNELWNSLWEMAPFSYYNERLDELEATIEGLKEEVKLLRRHRHIHSGESVVTL